MTLFSFCYWFLGHQNKLTAVYGQSKTPGSAKKASRNIPQAPERILDAPEILDDYCKSHDINQEKNF